jgi:hypothetical protein
MPLNGATAVTEGARLQRLIGSCSFPSYIPQKGNPQGCYPPKESIQAPITPSENSRIMQLTANYSGTLLNGGGVTQSRAREVLAAAAKSQQLGSEGVKVERLIQTTQQCSTDVFNTDTRFSAYNTPPVLVVCPPLPAPPAPPARACILQKNQKFFGQ